MTDKIDYKLLCEQVQQIARETGSFIREESTKISNEDVQLKSAASLVTYVDKTAETRIVSALKELIPESGFVAEERTAGRHHQLCSWHFAALGQHCAKRRRRTGFGSCL